MSDKCGQREEEQACVDAVSPPIEEPYIGWCIVGRNNTGATISAIHLYEDCSFLRPGPNSRTTAITAEFTRFFPELRICRSCECRAETAEQVRRGRVAAVAGGLTAARSGR